MQAAFISISFPITQLVTQAPLFYIDSPFHWYEIEVAKGLAAMGQLLGYDPYFAAGYAGGIGFNVSAKFPAALCIVLAPWLSTAVTYKLYVFVATILGPPCIPLAGRWLKLPGPVSAAATTFGVLMWWLSALRWFHTAGLVSFVLCSYLALPYTALVIRFLCASADAWPVFLLLAVFGAMGMFLHPLFPLLVAPLVVALSVAYRRELKARRLVYVYVVLPSLCLLPNLLWVLPMLKYPSFATGVVQPYQRAVDISIIWNEALGRITQDARGSRLNVVLWVLIWWALVARLQPQAKRTIIAIAFASIGLIFFAALGAALPFAGTLQPNRLSSAAYLYLCIPAGFGIVAMFQGVISHGGQRIVALTSVGMLVAAGSFFVREMARELSYADIPHHGERPPEVRGIGETSTWIVEWLEKKTNPDARVLFETSMGRIHDDAHMAGYYARVTDREFIGGPYPYVFFSGFWDDYVFGRPIQSFSQQEFADYLGLYNIGWIIVFSEASKQFLDSMPGVVPQDRFGPFQTYGVSGSHSFFLEGSGTVSARSFNRIELSELRGAVVLKYHYIPGLETIPSVRLEPVIMLSDPQPFIRILNPPAHLILWLRE